MCSIEQIFSFAHDRPRRSYVFFPLFSRSHPQRTISLDFYFGVLSEHKVSESHFTHFHVRRKCKEKDAHARGKYFAVVSIRCRAFLEFPLLSFHTLSLSLSLSFSPDISTYFAFFSLPSFVRYFSVSPSILSNNIPFFLFPYLSFFLSLYFSLSFFFFRSLSLSHTHCLPLSLFLLEHAHHLHPLLSPL